MQLEYIQRLSEAYVVDNELYKEKIKASDLTENFHSLIKELRNDQPYLYQTILEMNFFEQEKVFRNYFDWTFHPERNLLHEFNEEDFESHEILNEDFSLIPSLTNIIILMIIYFSSRGRITKLIMSSVNRTMQFINFIGRKLASVGTSSRLAYSIIQENTKKCYTQCGFDPKNPTLSDFFYQMEKNTNLRELGRLLKSEESEAMMDCLRDCYVYSLKETIKLTAHNYFSCLKNTGDLSKLPHEKDPTAFQKILLTTQLSESCDDLVQNLSKLLQTYDNVLKLVYGENSYIEIRKKKIELMDEIYNIQRDFKPTNYQVQSYPKKFDNRNRK